MKLARITKPLRSVQVRVMLAGDLNASLERYAQYYEHVHGDSVDTSALIPEILRAFLDADREFQSWSRSADRPATPRPRSAFLQRQRQDSTVTCIINEVPADVLRTCLRLTRHSSLWMKDVYQSVHGPSESGVTAGAFPYTRACTARRPVRSTSA